jgi:hypothetical protein
LLLLCWLVLLRVAVGSVPSAVLRFGQKRKTKCEPATASTWQFVSFFIFGLISSSQHRYDNVVVVVVALNMCVRAEVLKVADGCVEIMKFKKTHHAFVNLEQQLPGGTCYMDELQ